MTTIHQPLLGELSYQQQAAKTLISLPCFVHKPAVIYCLILDEKGRELTNQKITQEVGHPVIALQIPQLKAGVYNCWIEIEGKMHIRQLHIAKSKRTGLLKKLFNKY